MAERVTQATRRALTAGDADARVTQATRRALTAGDADARVTQATRRVLVSAWAVIGQRAEVRLID